LRKWHFKAFLGALEIPLGGHKKRRVRRWSFPRAAMAIPACGDWQFRRRRFQGLLPENERWQEAPDS